MDKDEAEVRQTVQRYFEGLHHADVEKLRKVFAPDCVLKAPGIRRDLDTWLTLVVNRPSPVSRGDRFAYRVLSADIAGDQALVKVECPLLGDLFLDFLGLLHEQGRWRIVNKMYADKQPHPDPLRGDQPLT